MQYATRTQAAIRILIPKRALNRCKKLQYNIYKRHRNRRKALGHQLVSMNFQRRQKKSRNAVGVPPNQPQKHHSISRTSGAPARKLSYRRHQRYITRDLVSLLITLVLIVCAFFLKKRPKQTQQAVLTFGAIGKQGWLGNQLFQVASTIGIARSHGLKWEFPESISGTEFGSLCNLTGLLKVDELVTAFNYPEHQGTYYKIALPADKPLISLSGYFQSPLYFDKYRAEIKKVLRVNGHVLRRVEREVPEVAWANAVAVHVRRGDYLGLRNIYNILNIEYYLDALSRFKQVDVVLVASNDMEWCKEKFQGLPYKIVFSPFKNDPIHDFVLLARAKSLVMANSSMSWWAAYFKMLYFGNGTIISPKPWYVRNGPLGTLNSREFYLDHWNIIASR